MSASNPDTAASRLLQSLRVWRARLAPVAAAAVAGVFLYWAWLYRALIISTFEKAGIVSVAFVLFLLLISLVLTVLAFSILVRAKGYSFSLIDAYHSLNVSQLASMIPGGIWGYAGLAGVLWTKRVSKTDSVIIILVYTVIMLSACAALGIVAVASILGWGYAAASLLPLVLLLAGRSWIERLRERYFPATSPLPSIRALTQVLGLGIAIWLLAALGFAALLYNSVGPGIIPFWTVAGAYAAGYLGGYISVFAPSGLGVTEGIVALLLGGYIGTERVLAIAISFRIIQTLLVWCNILLTVLLKAGAPREVSA